MTDSSIYITFMRHGRSRAADEDVLGGRYDSPLTDVGRAQAQERARLWLAEGVHFDMIIASTLCRARETAEIIGQILHVPVETEPDWMEMDKGPLNGLSRQVAGIRYPRPAFRNPYESIAGTGESEWQLHCRAAQAVEHIIRRGAGQYLVVAHGGILNAALRHVVGATTLVNGQGIWFAFGDAGYARTVYIPERHIWELRELRV